MRKQTQQQLIIEALNELKAGEPGMSEKELDQNRKEMLKKACVANGIMLALISVAIILAVFSWFTVFRSDAFINNLKVFTSKELSISFSTYPGTMLNDGTLSFSTDDYNLTNFNPTVATVFPGEKRYFKTIIKNGEENACTGALTLPSLLVNKTLVDATSKTNYYVEGGVTYAEVYSNAISFRVDAKYNANLNKDLDSTLYPKLKDSAHYLVGPQNYFVNGSLSNDYYLFNTQYICANITIPPRKSANEPSEYEIIWEFQVDGDSIFNNSDPQLDIMDKSLLQFNQMKFIVK